MKTVDDMTFCAGSYVFEVRSQSVDDTIYFNTHAQGKSFFSTEL